MFYQGEIRPAGIAFRFIAPALTLSAENRTVTENGDHLFKAPFEFEGQLTPFLTADRTGERTRAKPGVPPAGIRFGQR